MTQSTDVDPTPNFRMGNHAAIAELIAENAAKANGVTGDPRDDRIYVLTETVHLGEECGEALGAIRRYLCLARRNGTLVEALDELADVVLAAYIAAYLIDGDLDSAIDDKLEIIFTRGWKQ